MTDVIKILAKAAAPDEAGPLGMILLCVFIFGVAAMLAFFPVRLARIREHRHAEVLVAASILWCLLASASVIYPVVTRASYFHDHNTLMMQGLEDPKDSSEEPGWPWPVWGGLALGYAGLMAAAARGAAGELEPRQSDDEPDQQNGA